MTPYEQYLTLSNEQRRSFISSMTDSEEKASQLLTAMIEECRAKRKHQYDMLNQFELQYDDQINNTTLWVEAIQNIKTSLPKPV